MEVTLGLDKERHVYMQWCKKWNTTSANPTVPHMDRGKPAETCRYIPCVLMRSTIEKYKNACAAMQACQPCLAGPSGSMGS